MKDPVILLPLARVEGAHLASLLDEFTELLSATAAHSDPALARLTPVAYPDDAAAAAEFADRTRDELLQRRAADAAVVAQALADFRRYGSEPLSPEDALAPRDVVIPEAKLDSWLRTLAALRLIIASRLGIADEDEDSTEQPAAEDPRRGVYDWLGYRLEGLVAAAED